MRSAFTEPSKAMGQVQARISVQDQGVGSKPSNARPCEASQPGRASTKMLTRLWKGLALGRGWAQGQGFPAGHLRTQLLTLAMTSAGGGQGQGRAVD